ncbi:MAG: ABC transporter permease [Candidatus Bathyarchaeota archaeon]|nr:ABC transporter permease [Candidatus Bathyarchaeota archaeon]
MSSAISKRTKRQSQIWLVMKKEFQLLWKDKKTLLVYLLGPILIVSALGTTGGTTLGANSNLTAGLVNNDSTKLASELVDQFHNSSHLQIGVEADNSTSFDELSKGNVQFVIVIPEDFGKNIQTGKKATVAIYVDNTDPLVPQNAKQATSQVMSEFQKQIAKEQNVQSNISLGFETNDFYNVKLKQADVMVSKVIPMVLVWIPMMMTGMAIVSERLRGTLSRSFKTPLSKVNIVLGKLAAYVVIVVIQIILIVSFAVAIFSLTFNASFFDVFLILLVNGLVGLGIGMLVSVLATTDRQVTETIPVVVLLMVILAGVFVPVRQMPDRMQSIAKLIPLYYSIDATKGALLIGHGLGYLWEDVVTLALYAFGFLGLAIVLLYFEEKIPRFLTGNR